MLTFYKAILLWGCDTTTLMNDTIIMKSLLNLFRKKFRTIIGMNGLELREKKITTSRIEARNVCVELTIDMIKKMN